MKNRSSLVRCVYFFTVQFLFVLCLEEMIGHFLWHCTYHLNPRARQSVRQSVSPIIFVSGLVVLSFIVL